MIRVCRMAGKYSIVGILAGSSQKGIAAEDVYTVFMKLDKQ